ncbi:MAG: lysylphosphatidylglycerol synthase domain-containing protein, partial [Catenulispora sp.]
MLGVVTLLAFAYVGRNYSHELSRLPQAKPLGIVLIVATFLPMRLLTSEVQRIGLKALGHRISTYESFMVSMINAYGNLLLPKGGLGLPAVYLKVKRGVPVADFATVQILPLTALQIATIGVTGVVALGVMHFAQGRPVDRRLLAVLGVIAAVSVVGTLTHFKVPDDWQRGAAPFLRRLSESWRRLGRSGHVASASIALHVGTLLLRGLRLQIAFWAIGQPVGYLPVFVTSLLADIAFFISITPGALGFREGAVALGAG